MPFPNPYRAPDPWGTVILGGLLMPGIVVGVDGAEAPEEWNVQRAIGSSFASTVWRGSKVAESITIQLAITNEEDFDTLEDVRAAVRPSRGKKPPSLSIVNPSLNFAGISRVACRAVSAPKWQAKGFWIYEIQLIEYNPLVLAKQGPSGPPEREGVAKAQTETERRLAEQANRTAAAQARAEAARNPDSLLAGFVPAP